MKQLYDYRRILYALLLCFGTLGMSSSCSTPTVENVPDGVVLTAFTVDAAADSIATLYESGHLTQAQANDLLDRLDDVQEGLDNTLRLYEAGNGDAAGDNLEIAQRRLRIIIDIVDAAIEAQQEQEG